MNPTSVFGQAADADDAAGQHVLQQPAHACRPACRPPAPHCSATNTTPTSTRSNATSGRRPCSARTAPAAARRRARTRRPRSSFTACRPAGVSGRAQDNQHDFDVREVDGRTDHDVRGSLPLPLRPRSRCRSRKPCGINAVLTGRQHALAGCDIDAGSRRTRGAAAVGFAARTRCPPTPLFSSIAPAAAARPTISSCTRAACADGGPMTRPTTPRPAITAMFGSTPSSAPRSIVTGSAPGCGLPAMTRAASVGAAMAVLQVRAPPRASRARLACACSACSCALELEDALTQLLVVARDADAARSSWSRLPLTPSVSPAASPLQPRERAEGRRLESAGSPLLDCTWAEISST